MKTALPYQAVIFDLDGTLIDSSPSILQCFEAVLAEVDLQPLVPLTDSLIGPPLRQTLINLTGTTDNNLLDQLVERFKAHYDTEGFRGTKVYDGVGSLLARLAASGIPLAIATNKRRIPTMKILDHLQWTPCFHSIGTLDTPAPPHKDKATLIRFLLDSLHLDAASSLYVGDKWEDGLAADENGMIFCAATWGYGEWDTSSLHSGWLTVGSADELAQLIQPSHNG